MANVPLDRIIDTVQLRIPGTTKGGIQFEMFSVLDEFFEESGAWTDTVEVTTKQDTTAYRVGVPAGQIIRLASVVDANEQPVFATMEDIGTIDLAITPTALQKLTVKLVLNVADPLTRDAYPLVPQAITKRYNRALLDGVLGHMLSQSSKPYSNEQLAVYHLKRFRNGIAQARAATLRENTEGVATWAFPQSFRVRRRTT